MRFLLLLLIPSFAFAAGIEPNEPSEKVRSEEGFSFYIENDSRNIGGPGSDQGYSNGFKFSYVYAEDQFPGWAKPVTEISKDIQKEFEKSQTNFGISLGQQIYTPNNTDLTNLIPDDRPYAAWLYVGLAVQFKTPTHGHSLELDLGVIGPEAMGEQVQNNFHHVIGVPTTKGWKNQLQTEPTVQLGYQQRLKFIDLSQDDKNFFDVVPYFGASVGNVVIGAHVGTIARLGYNLPDDFGPTRPSASEGDSFVAPSTPRAEQNFSVYFFAGARGNAIARNIFLDGNTFHSSHHVTKYPFTADTEFGFGGQVGRVGVVWRFVTLSPEFEQKSNFNSFASLSFTYTKPF